MVETAGWSSLHCQLFAPPHLQICGCKITEQMRMIGHRTLGMHASGKDFIRGTYRLRVRGVFRGATHFEARQHYALLSASAPPQHRGRCFHMQ
jgi:hypothetical protein